MRILCLHEVSGKPLVKNRILKFIYECVESLGFFYPESTELSRIFMSLLPQSAENSTICMVRVLPVITLYSARRYWCNTNSKFSHFYFSYKSTLLSGLHYLKSKEFLNEYSLWILYRPDGMKKRDFHSTEVFYKDDFAGEISAEVFKSVSENFNDDNNFLEKLDLPMIGDLFGPLQERM